MAFVCNAFACTGVGGWGYVNIGPKTCADNPHTGIKNHGQIVSCLRSLYQVFCLNLVMQQSSIRWQYAVFADQSVVLATYIWCSAFDTSVGVNWFSENASVEFSLERSCNDVVFWTTSRGIVPLIYITTEVVFVSMWSSPVQINPCHTM